MPRKGVSTQRGDTRSDGRTEPNIPKNKPGNRLTDIAWGSKHYAMGEFERIGDEETGIPFGAQLRWNGTQDDFEALLPIEGIYVNRYQNPCTATSYVRDKEGRYVLDSDNNVLYRPCMRAAMIGADVCPPHGGKLPQTKAAARRRLEGSTDLVVARLLEIALDPKTEEKTVVQAITQILDRAGIKGGQEIEIKVPGWQEALKEIINGQANS